MHQQKQKLLDSILSAFGEKWDFAPTLLEIVRDPETPTTVFDLILEFINRVRQRVDMKKETKLLLQSITYERT